MYARIIFFKHTFSSHFPAFLSPSSTQAVQNCFPLLKPLRRVEFVASDIGYRREGSQMGKKVAFTSLFFKRRDVRHVSSPASWLWPSCKHPVTHSFRLEEKQSNEDEGFYGMNSSNSDSTESYLSDSSEGELKSFSSESSEATSEAFSIEAVARGIRSDRLFFEPGSTSSITGEVPIAEKIPIEGGIALELDSEEPYWDFRQSMEEVVMVQGLVEMQWLEKMLAWYLKMNEKRYHGIIVEAFLDLLLNLASCLSSGTDEERYQCNLSSL